MRAPRRARDEDRGDAAVAASAAAFAAFGPRRESWRESLCSYCDKIWSFMSVANSLTV